MAMLFTILLFSSPVNTIAQSNITRLEYYIDNDPGFGNATAINIVPDKELSNVIVPLNPSILSEGIHRFYVRARDADGRWSLTNTLLFYKPYTIGVNPGPASNITRLEYYFDTDPGYGKGIAVNIAPGTDLPDLVLAASIDTLSGGAHQFYVRARNANGNWSLVNSTSFSKTTDSTFYRDFDKDNYGDPKVDSVAAVRPAGYIPNNKDCNDSNAAVHPGAAEICGNGIDEDCNGSDSLCNLPAGALNFDGIDDHVQMTSRIVPTSGDFTVEYWINSNSVTGYKEFISQGSLGDAFYFGTIDGSGIIHCGDMWPNTGIVLPLNKWVHLALTKSGTTATLFLDSVQVATKTGYSISAAGTNTQLGTQYYNVANPEYPKASMDELRIWNRALTQQEIQQTLTCNLTGNEAGLIAYYNFDQGIPNSDNTGLTNLTDLGPNHFNGTLRNFALKGSISNWISPSAFPAGAFCNIATKVYYRDADNDNYGDPLKDSIASSRPTGYVLDKTDCNDSNAAIYPGATEICDGKDNDCDGIIDNGFAPRAVKGNPAACIGTTLSLKAAGGTAYNWRGPKGFTASTDSIAISNMQLADSGNYSVTITGPCDSVTITTRVFVVSPPKAAITGLNGAYCFNDPVSVLTGIPSGGTFSGTGITGNTFTPNLVGSSTISYISPAYYGCPADTAKLSTIVYDLPTLTVTNSGTAFLCRGDSVKLTANSNASSFLWSDGSTANNVWVTSPDTLTVTVTNATGCKKTSAPIIIANDPVPHIVSNAGTAICADDQVQLSFNGNNVVWTTNVNSSSVTGSPITVSPAVTTLYKVTGTSLNNCNYRDSTTIKVNPNATPGVVTNMFPPNGAANLAPPVTLSWLPGTNNTKYDIHIWKTSEQQESTGSSIPTFNVAEPFDGLALNTQYSWRIISHNGGCKDTAGAIQTFSVKALPDLQPQAIAIPTPIVGGQDLTLSWRIVNKGAGSTGTASWINNVYLSFNKTLEKNTDTLVASRLNVSALDSAQSYNDTVVVHIPVNLAGTFYIIVETDGNSFVRESNESNNIVTSDTSFMINLPFLPDLQVAEIIPQTDVYSGDTIDVFYKVINKGKAAVTKLVTDNIFITGSAQLGDITKLKLAGTVQDSLSLEPEKSKIVHARALLPPHVSGTLFVHVYTDVTNQVFEGFADDNNSSSTAINVFLSPAPDLTAYNLEMADTVQAGSFATFRYTIKNIGFDKTDSSWFDGLFLSRDTLFDLARAIPVKLININNKTLVLPPNVQINSGGMKAGDSLNFYFTERIPDTLSGKYNAFVVTDVFNNIFEYNKENNNILRRGNASSLVTTSNQPVIVLAPDLAIGTINLPSSISAGVPFTISWETQNIGLGTIGTSSKRDGIYFSSTSDIHDAKLIGEITYSTPLSPGAKIVQQKQVTIPVDKNGPGYIFIYADNQNAIFETNETNNSKSVAVQASLTNWADVSAGIFSISDTLTTTTASNFSISVQNTGNLAADGIWTDNLYISKLPTWNKDSATLLKAFTHDGNTPAGGAYSSNDVVVLPPTYKLINGRDSAKYYFYYIADVNNQLYENTGDTNNIFQSKAFFVYDLLVDHRVDEVTGADTAFVGYPYSLKWKVTNLRDRSGADYYNNWADVVYLSSDSDFYTPNHFGTAKLITTPLDHNATYNSTINYSAPHGYAGDYYVFVYSDADNSILTETNRNNNYNLIRDANGKAKLIHFIERPAPDLVAQSFTAPATGIAGQPITLTYSVINKGVGPTTVSWSDQVSLSPGYFSTNNLLFDFTHTSVLPIDSSYKGAGQIFLPANANGNYILSFKTDAGDRVYEAGAEDNNYLFQPITIVQLPPCDLRAFGVVIPDSALSGSTQFISWKIENIGTNPAFGYTREGVYLSRDKVLDNDDPLIGTVSNNINLPFGSSVTHSLTANLNGAAAGYNYILIKADLLNNIVESDENNNTTVSADSMFIYMKRLVIETPYTDTLNNSSLNYYQITVPDSLAGATLLVSCLGDTLKGNTELYVSFNQIPSPGVYDFAANNPFQKQKLLVIPSLRAGIYYLAVKGAISGATMQPIRLLAHILPFAISSVETNHGGNSGNVTVKIFGSKFEPGMTAHLLSASPGVDIVAASLSYINSTTLWATFNLNQKPLGVYNVKLTKTDNTSAVLDKGFTIEKPVTGIFYTGTSNTGMTGSPDGPGCDPGAEAGSNQNLVLSINAPARERTGRNIPITILFANQGNTDIPMPTRLLVSDYFPIAWQPSFPNYNNKDLFIEFSEPGGPPGILRAGASGTITFYTRVTIPVLNHFILK